MFKNIISKMLLACLFLSAGMIHASPSAPPVPTYGKNLLEAAIIVGVPIGIAYALYKGFCKFIDDSYSNNFLGFWGNRYTYVEPTFKPAGEPHLDESFEAFMRAVHHKKVDKTKNDTQPITATSDTVVESGSLYS